MNDPVYVAVDPGLLIGLCVFSGILAALLVASTAILCVQACSLQLWVEKLKQNWVGRISP